MKTLTQHWYYPDTTLEQVHRMLEATEFRQAAGERIRSLRQKIGFQDDGSLLHVHIELVHSGAKVPSFAKRFVGDEITIQRREVWHSPTNGSIEIFIPGKPGRLEGELELRADVGGVLYRIDAQLQVKIPLVGAKIEELVAKLLTRALNAEHEVALEWLGQPQS